MIFRFLLRKIFLFFFSLFLVATFTFLLMRSVPGDPFTQEQAVPEEIMKSMYTHYGLDKPWYVQYFRYLKGLVTWDLGPSYKYEGQLVEDIIREGFSVSAILGLEALCLSMFLGITLGSIAAVYHTKWQDRLSMILATLGISIPNFILATLLQYLFAMKFDMLPIARWGNFSHSILPTLSLAAFPTAFIARLIRTNMIEVLQQDYIQTALSKGLSMTQVLFKHVLKNSLLPVLSYLGPLTSSILTGSFIIEKIFGIPGLGGWFVSSIINRDYTAIMGITIFYSVILMLAVFFVDILYSIFDPRIKLIQEKRK